MNRTLALILLIMLGAVLLHSLYSMYHGRFGEAMIMYPLLVVCYLVFMGRGKWKLGGDEEDPRDDSPGDNHEDHPSRR